MTDTPSGASVADLRRLAERMIRTHDIGWGDGTETGQAILALLDERDGYKAGRDNAVTMMVAAERRVAALEEVLRAAEVYISHYVPVEAAQIDGFDPESWASEARALLASASNEAEVPAAPPADDGTPYQSPDLHTGTEHSDRVLTDDK